MGSELKTEWRRAAGLFGFIAVLHGVGFALLFGSAGALGAGVGITAYTLGMRHAFDADHIAAIDNTTRKLMADGQRPLSVGFWFSLGHSSVVFALAAVVAAGVRGVAGNDSAAHRVGGVVGPLVSGTFLLLIGLTNLVLLLRRRPATGPLTRVFGRATAAVRHPWHMYPLGFLFGLGFDTATEVALLATAGGAATAGLPFYAVLCLPILFAAGMSLLDTIDGVMMRFAYGRATTGRLPYNVVVTGLSVAVALGIGSVEILQATAGRLEGIDLNLMGFLIVGLFAVTWIGAAAIGRLRQVEGTL